MDEEKRKQKEEAKQKRLQEREEEKLRKQEEKARKKADKDLLVKKQKAEKELISKKRLLNMPEHSMKLMKVIIDQDITKFDFCCEFKKEAEKNNLNYVIEPQILPQSITWSRSAEEYYINDDQEVCCFTKTVDENHVVVVWTHEDIVNHISNDTFISTLSNYKSFVHNNKLTLVIYKIENYFKYSKNHKNDEPGS